MKKEEKKVEKEQKFKVSEIFTNKRYYAIANLIFYSVIILMLIASVRVKTTATTNSSKQDSIQSNYISGFESIKSKNFNFEYIVKTKDQEIIYQGKQRDDKILFTNQADKKEYFKHNNIILEKKNDEFVLNQTLQIYFDFFDVDLIKEILQVSTFEDGEYFITNKDFSEKVEFSKTEDIIYGVYMRIFKQNKVITGIEFDFSEISDEVESITLQYKNYGLVEDFDIK